MIRRYITCLSDHSNTSHTNLAPYIIITILITVFPVLYFTHPYDYSVSTSLYFAVCCWNFTYLFLERLEGWEKERERNNNLQEKHGSVASHMPPTGDLAHNPGMCPDRKSNQGPFGLQDSVRSTESHQSGPNLYFLVPSPFSSIHPNPFPSGNHQNVHCICESVSVLFVHLFCSLFLIL